jgi:hypothetical protein
MGKTSEEVIIEKLDEIKELLEEIKTNTTPAPVFVPSVWPVTEDGSDNWDGNNGWWTISADPDAAPIECCSAVADDKGQYSPNPNCGCSRCDSSAGGKGCVRCGCRNIAIYTEDGNWWCNRCHRRSFLSDGSPRPDLL